MSDKVVKRVAADIGGTFTDIAAVTEDGELLTWKLPSTLQILLMLFPRVSRHISKTFDKTIRN